MRQTFIGRLGAAVEPLMRPLEFDWRMSVSLITGFVAKGIVIGTLGAFYEVGGEEDSAGRPQALRASAPLRPWPSWSSSCSIPPAWPR